MTYEQWMLVVVFVVFVIAEVGWLAHVTRPYRRGKDGKYVGKNY